MTSGRAILWLAPMLLALSACHFSRANSCHQPQPYMSARSVAPLKIPAGLDAPETGNALRIPALNEPAPPAHKGKDPCLDAPPSFKVRQAAPTPQA
ncbi:MAG TPA: hypothetical protein VGD47_10720 [Steroidobacteraceae bacterium]